MKKNAHIVLKADVDMKEYAKLMLACPAGLYKLDDNGGGAFRLCRCVECGTCRVLGGRTIIEKWSYPVGTFGVEYRCG